MSSVFTARPAAISTFSTSTVSVLPPASTSSVTLSLPTVAFFTLRAGEHGDPALPEALGEDVGGLRVLEGQDAGQGLDQRDLRAERVEDVGELAADRAGADDRHASSGACSRNSASSELMTVVLLISSPICGMPFTREPVAITTAFFASYASFAHLHRAVLAAARPCP